ncbi:MAG: hypothetical protein ACI9JM_000106 [Halioglobus sp.]|jgi:hypothetical protein
MKKRKLQLVLLIALFCPMVAKAFPIASFGDGLIAVVNSTEDIIATYLGNSAQFSNDLFYGFTTGDTSNFIFNNQETPLNTSVNLGSFAIGTELIFRLGVRDNNTNFLTGPGDRNLDGEIHARIQENWIPNVALVSFEDLVGGPFDFNDLSFSFSNISGVSFGVPVVGTLALCLGGLLAVFGVRRKER